MELNILNLYRDFLVPLTPSKEVSDILKVVMAGGETTHDFAELISRDAELLSWVEITAQRSGRSSKAGGLDYVVSMLGLNRVRNMIVGRSIERATIPEDKTLLAKLIAESSRSKTSAPPSNTPKRKSEEENEAKEELEENNKVIPDIMAFDKYAGYAKRAEAASVEIKNSYIGQAYAGGVLFDYLDAYFSQISYETLVEDIRFQKPQKFIEELFVDGLRCAIAADEITKFVQIKYQRNVFFTALIRNIGKAILLAYNPADYEKSVKIHMEAKKSGIPLRMSDAEEEVFDIDHAQVSALYIGRVPCLTGIEKSLDYHHNPRMLKSRDRDLHALSCVLRVAGLLTIVYQENRAKNPDIQKMPDRGVINSDIYQVLRLTPAEWSKIKGNYAMNILKIGI